MGNKTNKDSNIFPNKDSNAFPNKYSNVFSKNLINLIFAMPKDFTIFFKSDNKNEILFRMDVHKIILYALPTSFFSALSESEDNSFILTIPKVSAEVIHAIFCRIYEIKNDIFDTENLEKFFWKYYLQLYLLHRYFCLPDDFYDLCILFYGYQLYMSHQNAVINVKDIIEDIISSEDSENTSEIDTSEIEIINSKNIKISHRLPQNLLVSPEDFDLLLSVIEIIGYDDYHLRIIWLNAPSDYVSRISLDVSDKLLKFVQRLCQK